MSNLASGSDVTWDGKKFTNTKLGISGLMGTNGYVSFGPNFGGLIVQWVVVNSKTINAEGYSTESLPIAYSAIHFGCWMDTLDAFLPDAMYGAAPNGLTAINYAFRRSSDPVEYKATILSVGV